MMLLDTDSGFCGKLYEESADVQELQNFLQLDNPVCDFSSDRYIANYFDYESGKNEPILKGRLASALPYWRDVLQAPPSVLNMVTNGYCIDFETEPPPMYLPNNKKI